MGMLIQTGCVVSLSTTGLARMAAAGLAQNYSPPQVSCQLGQFFRQRHLLVEVGEKFAWGSMTPMRFFHDHILGV
jgi:hypothetical protein